MKKDLEARIAFAENMSDLFKTENLDAYTCVQKKKVSGQDKLLPVFSLDELFGEKYVQYSHPIKKIVTFAFGTDTAIRKYLTPRDQWKYHFGETGGGVALMSLFPYILIEHQILALALTAIFSDGAFRMIKQMNGHERPHSGFIGAFSEGLSEVIDYVRDLCRPAKVAV